MRMITNVYKTRIGKKAQITDTIIIGGIILAFIIYMWYAEINAPEVQQAYVGENQLAILQTAAKAEKALLFVDSAAKIAVDSAASQLSRQGGMYYFDSEVSPCNDYYGYNFWQVTENGVLKRCYPDDISSMMSSAVSESLANQFSKYPGQELNKYDIDYTFISEGDQIRGIAANPLEFDIVVEKKADITQKADEQKQEELKKSSSEVEAAVSKMIEEQTQKYYDTPYVIGGSDVETGIDCSGWVSYLVNYIRAQNGLDPISKGHGPIAEQWGSAKYTTMISESELRPGDIILLDRPYGGTGNWMTTSTWDHIAMVYKKGDQLWVSESSGGSHLKDTAYSEFIAYRKKQQEEKPGFNIGFARVNSLEEIFINGMTGSSGETSTGAGQGSSAQDTQSSSAVSGETFIVIDGRDDGSKNILYLISGGKIVHSYEVAIGENGMGKTKENDHKTPIGTYKIKWKASVFSDEDGGNKILPNKAFCGPGSIFTTDPNVGFKSESLWQPGYGGESAVVMGIDYPNSEDRAKGYTGSCIEIHASKLQTTGKDSAGCVRMNPPEARELYKAIEVGTKVIFERGPVDINEYLTSNAKSSQTQTLDAPKTATSTGINAYSQQSVNSGKGVPVLIYHAVKDGKPGETIISVEKFSEQMKYLNDEGYKTISITDLVNFMKTGAAVPEKAIVLTFDDGWISIKDVIPILNQYGFKASFWIFPGTGIGGPYMGWNDIIDISKNPNFEIGSHSMTHPWDKQDNLVTWVDGKTAGKTEKDAEQEIKESKRILEEKIGKDVKYFAWPVGWYNDKLISIAKDAGYQGLLTVEDGANYQGDDVFRIKRIFIDGACSIDDFKQTLKDYEYKSCSPNPTLGNSPYGYATGQIQRTSPSNEDCAAYGKEPDFTYLIADTDFTDVNAAKPEQIQAFFDKMGSAVKDPVDGVLLSQAIYDAGQKYQISPIVLLATLQKEQSLLTQKSLTQRQKDYAAGCGCPDTSSCNEKYKGFQNQMECMAAILKKHYDAGAKLDYPYTFKGLNYDNKKCSNGQPTELDIKNAATYSLYKYTPHTYDYCLSTKGGANFNFRNLYIKYYQDITSSQPACRATTGLETETVVTESGEQKTYIVRTIGKYKINPSFSVTADYDFSQYDTIKKQVRGYGGNKGVLDLVADCERSDSSSSAPGSLPASNLGECVNSAVNTVNSRQEMKDSNLLMFNGPCDPRENLLSDFIEGFGDCSKSEDDDCYCEINLEQSGQPDFKEDVEINVKKEGSGTIISLANIGKDVVKNTGNIWSYSFDNALKEEKTLSVKGGKGTLYVKKETGTTSTMSVSDKAPENTKKCGVEKRKFKFCVQQAKEGKGNAPLNYDFALEFADSIPPAPVENLKAKDKKDAKSSIIIEFYAPKENGVIVPDLKDYLVYCSSTAFIKDSAGNLILDGLSLLTIIEPKDENGFMQTINEEITYCEDAEIKDGQQYYIAVTPIDWNNNEGIAREVSAISIDDSVSMPAPE